MIRAGLFVFLLFMIPSGPCRAVQAPPGTPRLTVSATPSPVTVGGIVTLTLNCELPAGAHADSEIRGIEGLSVVKKEASGKRIVIKVIADTLEPLKIGPIELGYLDKDGKKGYVRAEALTVGVSSNMKGGSDSENLRAIKGIIPIKNPWIKRAAAAGLVLLVLAAAAAIFLAFRKWRGKGSPVLPSDPPHVRAEKEIEALLGERLFEKGHRKEFYFRFTEIIKRYIEAIRGFPAAEYTTEEIAQRILDQDRPILAVLRRADLVKFADETALPQRKDEDISCFLAYINVTAPKQEEPASGNNAGEGVK